MDPLYQGAGEEGNGESESDRGDEEGEGEGWGGDNLDLLATSSLNDVASYLVTSFGVCPPKGFKAFSHDVTFTPPMSPIFQALL